MISEKKKMNVIKAENEAEEVSEVREELIAIYNNSNEIFQISTGILRPRGNARVPMSEGKKLVEKKKHAIHYDRIEQSDTMAKLVSEKEKLSAEIAALKAENEKLKVGSKKSE